MLSLPIMAALAASGMTNIQPANQISFFLRAVVPVRCSVTDIVPDEIATGRVNVSAVCNADSFRLVMGGDLADMTPVGAATDGARIAISSNSVSVRPERPGAFTFQLDYGEDLDAAAFVNARIETF